MDNTYVYVLIGYHGKKKIRIDGFHGDYLTVSFCEGLDTAVSAVNAVTAIRGKGSGRHSLGLGKANCLPCLQTQGPQRWR